MKRRFLFFYQLVAALSDTTTGLMLIFAPATTMRLMKLHAVGDALPFLSYIGVFVLSVGIACFYGASLVKPALATEKLEVVWLLTGITRALVAMFVVGKVVAGGLEPGWITVALTDGLFALLQFFGLSKGWLRHLRD